MARLLAACRNLFRRDQRERDLHAEINSYVELRTQEKASTDTPAAVARRETLMEVEGVDQLKEQVRDARSGAWLEQLLQDLRFGLRVLRRSPGFTTVAVLTVAVAIGANTAIFSVIYGVLLQPLPYPEADRVAKVFVHFSPQNAPHGHMCVMDFLDWRAQNHVFEEPSVYANGLYNITGIGQPAQARGVSVTAGFFPTMRVQPLIGRTFLPGDDSGASPNLVVLGEKLWRKRFGASSAAIGQAIEINGQKATIVGVMPESFRFPTEDSELWANLRLTTPRGRFPFFLTGVARLKPGVRWEQAQAETNRIGRLIEIASNGGYRNLTFPVVPIREVLVGDTRRPLIIMFCAVLAVLLIACANVANLLLARSTLRAREMAVRVSIGAKPARLVRQLLTESVALSLVGAALGVVLAWYGLSLLRAWNPGNLPRIGDVHLNGPVLGFSIAVALLTGVLFGVAPALQSAHTEPSHALKQDVRAGSGRGQQTRAALAVAEIALSFVLLIIGGLLLRSFERLQHVDTGMTASPESVLTMLVSPSPTRYKDQKAQAAILDRLMEQVQQVPGIEAAAWADSRPPNYWSNDDTFHILGQPWSHEAFPSSPLPVISPDYFRVLGVPLLRGRYFDQDDTAQRPNVAIISESMARHYFTNQDPLGQEIAASAPDLKNPWYRIVGVVGDVKYGGMASEVTPVWYNAVAQGAGLPMFLMVRSSHSPSALGPEIERAIHSVDPDVVITYRETLDEVMHNAVAQPRFRTGLLTLFAAIALLLASIGTYGVIAYSVTQRTREIGIRMALGAQREQVLSMILRQGARLGILGILIGVAGALAATRGLSSLLFATSARDLLTFSAVTVILLGVSVWASFVPARRAMRVNPVEALRWE